MDQRYAVIADPYLDDQSRIISLLQPHFTCIRSGSLRETWLTTREKMQRLGSGEHLLLILELNQPDGDGIELIRYARTDPVLQPILIACVTYRASNRDKLIAFRMGADSYVIKPDLPPNFAKQMVLLHQTGSSARAVTFGGSFGRQGTTTPL